MSTFVAVGYWAEVVIGTGTMVIAPIIVWRTNARYPQLHHARLKWACLIAWDELMDMAIVGFAVNSLLGNVAPGSLWTFAMACSVLSLLLSGPVVYILHELDPLRKAWRKAKKLTWHEARRLRSAV